MSFKFSARADTLDFRDRMYEPSLAKVPIAIDLEEYKKLKIPVQDQGKSYACTGFALATVVHYMLRRRDTNPDETLVSPSMLFEMARRYDQYPGERVPGSSARGAMKGWYNHGVCTAKLWPYKSGRKDRRLTSERSDDAATRPLGAYLRVNHQDLVAMHCALAEVGILFAVANVHEGWAPGFSKWGHLSKSKWPKSILPDGNIRPSLDMTGPHAFAIVGYNKDGFWVQNSWGDTWGTRGFGLLPYDDWLQHGLDVWVGRLGVPVVLKNPDSAAAVTAGAPASWASAVRELRCHLVRVNKDGYLRTDDRYGTSAEDLETMFEEDFPRITSRWKKKRILLYAGGGLSAPDAAVQHAVADYRSTLLKNEIYPIAFIWDTRFWKTIGDVLRDALSRIRFEPGLGAESDFMLDRLDDALEPLVREYAGKLHWDQMKQTALKATTLDEGAARLTLNHLARLAKKDPSIEIHLVGHSAGAIFLAPIVQLLTTKGKVTNGPMKGRRGFGMPVASCVLWAPACTSDLFHKTFFRAIELRRIRRFMLFTLTDKAERDDNCGSIYHKSLLYLISNALEENLRGPSDQHGEEIVGMENFVNDYPELLAKFRRKSARCQWVLAPNSSAKKGTQSTARRHGDFDDDDLTLLSTFGFITEGKGDLGEIKIRQSASSKRERGRKL